MLKTLKIPAKTVKIVIAIQVAIVAATLLVIAAFNSAHAGDRCECDQWVRVCGSHWGYGYGSKCWRCVHWACKYRRTPWGD
jgi:hypothetical protein